MIKLKVSYLILILFSITFTVKAQDLLSPEILWELDRISDPQVSPDQKRVLLRVTDYNLQKNTGKGKIIIIDLNSGESSTLLDTSVNAYNVRWRPDGAKIGFLKTEDGISQLFEVNPDGSGMNKISNFNQSISNFSYAPGQRHISFTSDVKLDSSLHDRYPDLPFANARIIDDLMYRHWDEWHNYKYSHLFVQDYSDGALTGSPVDIMKGEKNDTPLKPFGGAEDIVWSPDGKHLLYVSKKYTGKDYAISTDSDLYLYTLSDQSTKNLTEGMDGYDTGPVFSNDGSKIAWLNMERPGFESDRNVIWLMELSSNNKKPITGNFDMSASTINWTSDSRQIYFIAGTNATYQVFNIDLGGRRFRSIQPDNQDIRQITNGEHNYYSLAIAGNSLIGTKASISMPHELYSIDPESGQEQQITQVNKSILANLKVGRVEKRMITTSDQKDMLTWVIYPPDFDPGKKYPALLYCQGGPQSAVSQFFSYRWNFQLMAAKGYIVVAPNRRGLPTFGQDWNDAISEDWGGQAMEDYLAAIDALAKEPFVDENNLGAVGASFGGYSVYYLAGNHEQRFKAFISHCGLFNLESWYGSTEEMFFANWDIGGPYWLDPAPASYNKFSPHKFAGNWDTPILVIHGQKDFRVPVGQGLEAFSAAQLQDIPSRFLYFPEEGHWVLSPQNGVLWHRVFFDWLDRYLK